MQYTREQLIARIRAVATSYGIDPDVAVAQLRRESVNFNPFYVYGPGQSPQGAKGLAQFIDDTWAQYGAGSPFNPDHALDAWGRYMTHLLRKFDGGYAKALIGYHAGEGAVAGVLRNPAGNPKSTAYYKEILAQARPQKPSTPKPQKSKAKKAKSAR
jgi:soluble lytic murein transglycosylase-like protein